MKVIKVSYTVQPDYVDTNKQNIAAVMAFLRENPITGMTYNAFVLEDGQSFMHINIIEDEEAVSQLTQSEAFQSFRTQLSESNPVSPPKQEVLELVN